VHSTDQIHRPRPLGTIPGWTAGEDNQTQQRTRDQEQFYIQNSGGVSMSWRAEAATPARPVVKNCRARTPAGTLDPTEWAVKPETKLVYVIDPPGSSGNYTGTITVTADGAVDSPRKMEIAWTVLPGVDDSIRIVSQARPRLSPPGRPCCRREGDTSYNLQTKESGEIVVDVSAAGATTRTARAAITRGNGTKELTSRSSRSPPGPTR